MSCSPDWVGCAKFANLIIVGTNSGISHRNAAPASSTLTGEMRTLYNTAGNLINLRFCHCQCPQLLSPNAPFPFLSSQIPYLPLRNPSRPPISCENRLFSPPGSSSIRASMAYSTPSTAADTDTKPFSVLFVCLGNICRSPAAEGVFRDLVTKRTLDSKFKIDSAGTINYHEVGHP